MAQLKDLIVNGTSRFIGDIFGTLKGNADTATQAGRVFHGSCTTAADVANKIVTCSEYTTLTVGDIIFVTFSVVNSAAITSLTLNVNSTGAKPIKYMYNNVVSNIPAAGYLLAQTYIFHYDGTNWVIDNMHYNTNSTYNNMSLGNGYGTCTTAAVTAAKVVTLASYNLLVGGYISVLFTYDVPANATLNVNGKGAKDIFYKNAKITAGIISAGDLATFIYDGTQYRLVSKM